MSTLLSLPQRSLSALRTQPALTQKTKKIRSLSVVLLAVFVVSAAGWYRINYLPLPNQPVRLPDPLLVGGPDAAIKHTYKVIDLLRAANWDSDKLSLADLRLPDARYAETEALRNSQTTSYCLPNRPDGDPSNEPVYKDVACYTSLYARVNPTYYKGERVRFKPSGFYIVGWKDGRVTTVPIGDVRWNPGVKEKVALSFPGMPNYDASGPREAAVEFADGSPDPEKMRAYIKAVHQEPCATCNE